MKLRLKNLMIYMPFAYYYIGPVALTTYILASRSLLGRFSNWGLFFCVSFTLYVFLLLVGNDVWNGLYVIRFFWGFLFFYLIFRSGIQIQIDKILLFLSALTLLETLLVNTVLSAALLPNYPSMTNAAGHFANVGEYQRPYSFGGSASVTSVILVALLAVSKLGLRGKSLAIAAILFCMSGSGFVGLSIYFFSTTFLFARLLLVPALIGIVYSGVIYKISAEYILLLYEFKIDQIMNEVPVNSLLLGIPFEESMGGDFAGLSFFSLNGLVGIMFFLTVIFLNINKKNWLPILIMFVGTLHYGAIFYLPGQIMFGYFLNLKPEKILTHAPNQKDCHVCHEGGLMRAING